LHGGLWGKGESVISGAIMRRQGKAANAIHLVFTLAFSPRSYKDTQLPWYISGKSSTRSHNASSQ
jgi:hypothetical protein